MKIATIITLVLTILGLAFSWWATEMGLGAGQRIYDAHAKADVGVSSKDWTVTAKAIDDIRWGLKDLRISQGFVGLGLVVAFPMCIVSFILSILAWKRSRTRRPENNARSVT